jgi:hypothetical protein
MTANLSEENGTWTFWSVASGGAVAEGLCAAGEGYIGRLGSANGVLAAALGRCTRWPLSIGLLCLMSAMTMKAGDWISLGWIWWSRWPGSAW